MATRDETQHAPAPDTPADIETPEDEHDPIVDLRLKVRRAPNFPRFIIAGFVVGVLLGGLIDLLGPSLWGAGTSTMQQAGIDYGSLSDLMFLAAVCGLLGGVAGAAVAVLLDRRS